MIAISRYHTTLIPRTFARNGKFELAMEGLLDVLRVDKNYRKGLAKQIALSLLEIIGPDKMESRTYRSELASILH